MCGRLFVKAAERSDKLRKTLRNQDKTYVIQLEDPYTSNHGTKEARNQNSTAELSIYLPRYLSTVPIYLSIYLSIYRSVYLYRSIYLSVMCYTTKKKPFLGAARDTRSASTRAWVIGAGSWRKEPGHFLEAPLWFMVLGLHRE